MTMIRTPPFENKITYYTPIIYLSRGYIIQAAGCVSKLLPFVIINFMEQFGKSKWVSFKKDHPSPGKRWAHTSTLIGNSLYMFGGSLDQENQEGDDIFYKLCCETLQFESIENSTNPKLRDSHIAFTFNNVTNQCFAFDGNKWTKIQQHGHIPRARESSISLTKDCFVLLYGGCDEDTVFEDFNLFDLRSHTWYPVQGPHKFPKRENSTLSLIDNEIYLFGGQNDYDKKERFFSDIFKLTLSVNLPAVQLKSKLVKPKNQLCPLERSSHSAVVFENRHLIILGGLTYSITKGDSSHVLNDIWCFDSITLEWNEIKPPNSSLFKKRANFTADVYNAGIITFGGLKATNGNCYDDLMLFQLFDLNDYIVPETCNRCKMPFSLPAPADQKEPIPFQNQLGVNTKKQNINLKTIYKMAQLIPHPFHAVGLLIKSSLMIKATQIEIKLQEINYKKILTFFDNGLIVDKKEFQNIVFDCSIPENKKHAGSMVDYINSVKEYSNAIRYGCFKLSQSFMLVHTTQSGNTAAVLTSDNSYYYNIYYNQRYFESDPNNYKKMIDYAQVSTIFHAIGETHHSHYSTKKILFNLNCDGKKSNYEMVSEESDILLKRMVELDNQGESLKEYLGDLFLCPPLARIILNGRQLKFEPKQIICSTVKNAITIALIKNPQTYFRVYSNGFMVNKLISYKYKCGGIVVLPDSWDVNILGMGVSEEVGYLYELVDWALSSFKL